MNKIYNRPAFCRHLCRLLLITLLTGMAVPFGMAHAEKHSQSPEKIAAFLNVTGFDVALDSIGLSAQSAPGMLGMDPEVFGASWTRLTDQVFDTAVMRTLAVDILSATLDQDMLNHAVDFYATDLGQRLVEAENASHMMSDGDSKTDTGTQIVADLVAEGSGRLELLKRMNRAIDASGTSLRALQEVQIRFLLAASAARVIELNIDADELRALFKSQEAGLRLALQAGALAGAAYTYRDFSDEDVEAYATALEQDEMQKVYELLNAVQYEIMANRFEVLAGRMSELRSGQDI